MINKRTSSVNRIYANSLASASTLEIGDSRYIQGITRAIALQRERQLFYSNELNFSDFDIFREPIPFEPVTEEIFYETIALQPIIKVNSIKITGTSTSSIIQIGNSHSVYLESRIKHIRQLIPRD
jgi:spore germination protein PE